MVDNLSQRQIEVLKAIISEYTETSEPVGSEILEKKYKLGVSPATIRNEMVELAKKGFLKKTYFSSGRIPSAKGFRFYIKNLMKEKELSTSDEVSFKNSVWDEKKEVHQLLSQATKVLAEKTGLLSIAVTDIKGLYYSGIANLFDLPEFLDLEVTRNFFLRLEELNFWEKVLLQVEEVEDEIMCMLGEDDFDDPLFDSCASVLGEFEGEKIRGAIGVIGPKRMYYDVVIPQIKYFSKLIEEIFKEQGI